MVLKLFRNTPRCDAQEENASGFLDKSQKGPTQSYLPLISQTKASQQKAEPKEIVRQKVFFGPSWAQRSPFGNYWYFPSAHFPWLTGDFSLTTTNRALGKRSTAQLPVTVLSFDMFQPYFFKKRQLRKKKTMAHPCQLSSLSILNSAETEQFN